MITLILNMRTHNLTKLFNSILLLSALFLIAISIQKLFIQSENSSSLVELIGQIGKYQNDVRLKRSQALAWEFVNKEKIDLGLNDSVFTNAQSEVNLLLEDDQQLNLKSESLIRLKKRDEILLQSGEVEISLKENAKPIALNIGSQIYRLSAKKNATVKITNIDNQRSVQVETGSVEIAKDDQVLALKTGEAVDINEEKLNPIQADIKLLYPEGVVILQKGERLKPIYESNFPVKKVLLKRADKTFELDPGSDISLRGDAYTFTLLLEDQSINVPKVDFTLIKAIDPPIMVMPVNNSIYETSQNTYPIQFKFVDSLTKEIQIFDDTNSLIYSIQTSERIYTHKITGFGNYKWRIRYKENYNESPYTDFRTFTLKELNVADLKAIKIELKKPNQLVEFNWAANDEEEVIFQLSKDVNFQGDILEKKVKGSQTKISIPETGVFYWTVKGKTENKVPTKIIITPTPAPNRAPKIKNINIDIKVKSSQTNLFQTILNLLIPRAHASDQNQTLPIEIEEIDDAKIYEIEIYNEKDELVFRQQSPKANFEWAIPGSGKFRYRVRFQDFWRRWSPYSEFALININAIRAKQEKRQKKQSVAKKAKKKNKKKNKPTKLVKKDINTKKPKQFQLKSASLFHSTQALSSTQSGDTEFEIDGQSISGHALSLNFSSPYQFNDGFILYYQSQYGKVFDGEEYNQRNLIGALHFKLSSWDLLPVLGFHQHSIYEENGGEAKLAAIESTYSLGLIAKYPIIIGTKGMLSPFIKYTTLGVSEVSYGLSYGYHLKNAYSLLFQGASLNKSYLALSEEVEVQSFQLLSGISYDF